MVTVGAGDTLTTRFAWTNIGLGEFDLLNLVDQDNEQLTNSEFDQQPGQTLISSHHLIAPDVAGTYNWSQKLTVTDKGGNVITSSVNFIVKVDCSISDLAPPTALCRDRTYTILDGETQNLTALAIDDGSFDGCGGLNGRTIDVNTFACADEGQHIVTLTVRDLAGNSASCTATVTINVEDAIYEGPNGNCVSTTATVVGGQAWQDITTPNGKMIAQVIIGNNTNITGVKADIYKSTAATEDANGQAYLSKRISLLMTGAGGSVVQPNTDPVYVRLYYTDNEFVALSNASPGSTPLTWTIVKTSDLDCGDGYSGMNATAMNTTFINDGCSGEDGYFEFFTGSFSTFYLFANDAILPVELTAFDARATEKQQVQLDWKTATESGNSHFEIEHSTDASSFMYLGAVAGAGDAIQEQRYDFLHETPADGVNYYRLRQVDLDGTETLSEVREVTITAPDQLSIFPNPTTDQLSVKGFTGGPVRVLDLQGRTVLSQNLPEFGSLRVEALPAGIYLLQAGTETLRWVKR